MSGVDGTNGVAGDDLPRVAERIAAVSDSWAAALVPTVAAGARDAALRPGLSLGVEGIREGWLTHIGASRVLAEDTSNGLSLLIGDYCYAAGLCDIAATRDLDAVGTLADLIARTAELALEAPRDGDAPDPRVLAWDQALAELGPRG